MAINPVGRILATGAGGTDHDIRLWEVPSFRSLGDLSGHEGWITALRFSPDGQILASAAADQTVRLWDVATRTPVRIAGRLAADVWRVCFAPDGQRLFTGSADGAICRWDVEVAPAPEGPRVWRKPAEMEGVVTTPDARKFAASLHGSVWTGDIHEEGPAHQIPELGAGNTCLLFSSDGESLFAGTQDGEVQVWSLGRRQLLCRLRGSLDPVRTLALDRDGRLLVAGQSDRDFQAGGAYPPCRVGVWSTRSWQEQQSWTALGAGDVPFRIATDGRWVAVSAAPGLIQVRSVTDPPKTHELSHAGVICGLVFSPDGQLLATADSGGTVKVWEVPSFRERQRFRARVRELSALAFSPDSRRLATGGEGPEAIEIWDTGTWDGLMTLEHRGDGPRQVAFSPDGNLFTALSAQGDLCLWHVPSFGQIASLEGRRAAGE